MRHAVLLAALFLPCLASAAPLRGELSFDGKQDSFAVCGSTKTYWVRVLASNPHFLLFKRVEELKAKDSGAVLAVLEGEVGGPVSSQPTYAPDGVLTVKNVISVEHGQCP